MGEGRCERGEERGETGDERREMGDGRWETGERRPEEADGSSEGDGSGAWDFDRSIMKFHSPFTISALPIDLPSPVSNLPSPISRLPSPLSSYHRNMRLDDYLKKIGVPAQQPDLETLRQLHLAHRRTFIFENLDIQTGRGVRLDLETLERKFLDEGRGGYCFEQNTLFDAVLREVGYETTTLLARVRRGPRDRWVRTHMLLRVVIDGEPWIADVGFGGIGLLEPIPLGEGSSSDQGGLVYALRRDGHLWVLTMRDGSGESDLYEFSEDPQTPADVEMSNHYTSTYPDSIFRKTLTIQRATPEERTILRSDVFARCREGVMREEPLAAERLRAVAREEFGIVLPEEELLFEKLR